MCVCGESQGTHWVDGGVRIDLKSVDVISGVLEESIVWVEHVMAQQVQPLPSYASVIQSILSPEFDQQFPL